MNLIDEDDNVAPRANLLGDLLQAFFKVSAVATTGNQGPKVQRVELFVTQCLWNIALDDGLSQSLDNSSLSNPWFADQHRVILRATRQNLHDPLHFALATDNRVKLALASGLGEVAPKLIKNLGALVAGGFRATDRDRIFALVAREKLNDLLANSVQISAELHEDLSGNTLTLANEAKQDVLGADVVVAQLKGFAQAQLKNLLGPGSKGNVSGRSLLTLSNDFLDLLADSF